MEGHMVRTEDGVRLQVGDRAYNYYDMKPGTIGRIDPGTATDASGDWFDFHHDDGSRSILNGSRICTIEYARRRQFKDA